MGRFSVYTRGAINHLKKELGSSCSASNQLNHQSMAPQGTVEDVKNANVFLLNLSLLNPQGAQLGIHFYSFHNTQLEMHSFEGIDKGHSTGEENRRR